MMRIRGITIANRFVPDWFARTSVLGGSLVVGGSFVDVPFGGSLVTIPISDGMQVRVCVCACVCTCVRACVRACVRVCVCVIT